MKVNFIKTRNVCCQCGDKLKNVVENEKGSTFCSESCRKEWDDK